MDTQTPRHLLRWYFLLALIETLSALLWLMLLYAGSARNGAAGFPVGPMVLILPLLVFSLALGRLLLNFSRSTLPSERWSFRISALACRNSVYWTVIALAGLASVLSFYAFVIGVMAVDPSISNLAAALAPYNLWFLFLSIQTLVFIRWLRFGTSLKIFRACRSSLKATLLALSCFALISAWILWTGIGLRPDQIDWGQPGVPLLPYQVSLALGFTLTTLAVAGAALYAWRKLFHKPAFRLSEGSIDALVCLILWAGAVWIWSAEPLKPSFFAPKPVPPNNEYYPYSDAAIYDLSAQRLLIGSGFERNVLRPGYSLFLAVAQGISGIGYSSVIAWQVPILALLPALLYLLAKTLHHRSTGLLVGLLVIIRESNSLALIGVIDVSNSKLIMSDLPITLGVVLFCLIIVLWLTDVDKNRLHPFLAGGVLGVFMLVRTQIILLLPVVLVLAWFPFRKQPVRWLKSVMILLAGLVIALAPWLWRNWRLTGENVLADPQAAIIVPRYTSLVPERSQRLPGETRNAYQLRIKQETIRYLLEHPVETASVFASHYWNNQISTLLVLPSSYPVLVNLQITPQDPAHPGLYWLSFRDQCCSLMNYVKTSPYWFRNGAIKFTGGVWLPLIASMVLLSVGIGSTWSRNRLVSLVPLSLGVVYGLASALIRYSGWRYNLPVDWLGILYYSAGLMQVCFWVGMFFQNRFIPHVWESVPGVLAAEAHYSWKSFLLAGVGFFLLTAAVPLSEYLIPDRYHAMTVESVLASLEEDGLLESAGVDLATLDGLLQGDNAEALIGRAMYPRFYKAGKGLPGGGWPSYDPRDYNRLGFNLLPSNTPVILPAKIAPVQFPSASDVLVIGCRQSAHLDAVLVAILNEPKVILLRSPLGEWSCTTP